MLPIAVEVKTHGTELRVGAEIGVGLYMLQVEDPRALPVFEELQALVGGEGRPPDRGVQPATVQLRRFFERSEAVIREYACGKTVLERPIAHWAVVERLAQRALGGNATFDLAERGLIYFALPVTDNLEWVDHHQSIQKRVADLVGATADRPYKLSASIDLETIDHASAVVLPIALWRLSPDVRAAILNTDLIVGSYLDVQVLVEHCRERGVELDIADRTWIATKGDTSMRLPSADRARVMAEVAFGGASISSLAEKLADGFRS